MDTNVGHTTRTVTPTRAQPARDQILACLTEPRHAYETAAHTDRRAATITGHMRAMLRLRLVERAAYGVYTRALTLRGPAPADVLTRSHPIRYEILRFLTKPPWERTFPITCARRLSAQVARDVVPLEQTMQHSST